MLRLLGEFYCYLQCLKIGGDSVCWISASFFFFWPWEIDKSRMRTNVTATSGHSVNLTPNFCFVGKTHFSFHLFCGTFSPGTCWEISWIGMFFFFCGCRRVLERVGGKGWRLNKTNPVRVRLHKSRVMFAEAEAVYVDVDQGVVHLVVAIGTRRRLRWVWGYAQRYGLCYTCQCGNAAAVQCIQVRLLGREKKELEAFRSGGGRVKGIL